jgi:two-component system chemotaxis sensor kinase CheA
MAVAATQGRVASSSVAPPSGYILSLGGKLAALTVIVLALSSTLLYVELTARERVALVTAKRMAAAMVADLFAASLGAPLDFGDSDAINAALDDVKSNVDVVCTTIWAKGQDKPVAELRRGECDERPPPSEAELGGTRVLADRVEVARAIIGRAGGRVGTAVLVFSLARENATFATSRRRIFWLSAALAIGTALLLVALSRPLIVSPLAQLSTAARRIGRGDFGSQVNVKSRDEIGQLAAALNKMREAIADREQRLEAATQDLRDLFDHMGQAIVAFGPEGRVEGAVSRQAGKVFSRGELEGVSIRELLYGGADAHDVDAQAFDEWLSMAFEIPLDGWGDFAALAPREVTLRGDKRQVPLELEFRPVVKGGGIEKVMLLATDVSEKHKLKETVEAQEEEHARRMAAMRRLIAGGGQVFVTFIEGANDKIARCVALLGPAPRPLSTGEIDELFRYVHTIKGEARAFDLRELEAETAKLEEDLDELRALARGEGFATTGSVYGSLSSRLRRASEAIERGCEVFVAASPIGRAALDQVTVQRSDVTALEKLTSGKGDEVARIVERLAARPFGESTASLIDMAPTWADKEGKRVQLDVEGREVLVPPALARVLGGVMTHLVRNAIAHGIEPPGVRTERRKSTLGTIRAVARQGENGPTITLEDDGRGLDFEGIAAKAAQLGIEVEGKGRGSMAELVFVGGLSTLETAGALAGRGVGLDAVRGDLEGAGYAVDVASEPGKFTRFTLAPRGRA